MHHDNGGKMKNIQLIYQGRALLINLDQVVAVGISQYDTNKTWIEMTNGEEYTIDSPFDEILKSIPTDY